MKKIADNLPYLDTAGVVTQLSQFINNNFASVSGNPITDPLTQNSDRTRGEGTGLASTKDENKVLAGQSPKITFEYLDLDSDKLAGGKTDYRERFRHEIGIIYTCTQKQIWTRNSGSYVGGLQCIKYLQYLRDQIKLYSGSFPEWNEITFGAVSPPTPGRQTGTYQAFMPIKIDTYGRLGA